MLKFERLGVLLSPETRQVKTIAKFNAGMAREGEIVHMLFRYAEWREQCDPTRQSNYKVDEMRYARISLDGTVLFEAREGLLKPSLPMDNSGCQDARIVPFEGWFYLFYTGWDKDTAPAGKDTARVGIARTRDFQTAEKLGFVQHYAWDKDAFIFPERIGGKIAFMHRVEPNIQIDFFDSFTDLLNPGSWIGYRDRIGDSTVLQAAFPWECGKVGGSVPPIRTRAGWLVIYHAVETFSSQPLDFMYRAGIVLLELENPRKVIARLPYPVLSPEMDYELQGDVDRVVFPVGGYLHQDHLYISYGGADRVVALARAPMEEILNELAKYPVP